MKIFNNIPNFQRIILLVVFILFILLLILLFFINRLPETETELRPPLQVKEEPEREPVNIPLEFLEPEELDELGINFNIRAQVISRDPLIYKIINDEEDIITDISPFLEPIRE